MVRVLPGSVFKRCGCRKGKTGLRLGADCPRLGEEGHGSWFFSIDLPRQPGGPRRRVRRGGYATQTEAQAALARMREPAGRLLTVADWLELWLTTRVKLRPSTLRGYSAHVRLHLAPRLGLLLLAELDASHLQRLFTALLNADELSAASVRRVHSTLRTALNAAVREGLIGDNPARYLHLPRARRPRAVVWTARRVRQWQRTGQRPAVAVWTPAQTAQFLNAVTYHPLHAAFHLIALRGLRRGEAAGLRWHDIDLENKVMYVTWQVQYDNETGALVMCPLKTAASRRVVALDATTVAVLRAHLAAQQWACRANGVTPSGFVFTGADGGPVSPDYLTRTFRQLVEETGLPPVRLHDLRHGAATLALAAGADLKVVADQLGHCSIVLTADTYTSVAMELALAADEAVARLILRAGKRPPGGGRTRRAAVRPLAAVTAA
jgi:integrase